MKIALIIFFSLSFLFTSSQKPLTVGKIAFLGYNGDKSSVFVINSDGSDLRQVTHDSISIRTFTISPDGSELAASINGDIFIINIASGSMKKLTHNRSTYLPKWSPDGKYIAFCDRFGEYTELCVIDTGGLEYRRLTPYHTTGNMASTWATNSKEIAFQGKGYDFFIVNIDHPQEIRQITNTGSEEKPVVVRKLLSWSPDGNTIAYVHETEQQPTASIYIMNADGTEPKEILKGYGRETIGWSPDSKYLVVSLKDGIYIINLSGEVVKRLTDFNDKKTTMPAWSLK